MNWSEAKQLDRAKVEAQPTSCCQKVRRHSEPPLSKALRVKFPIEDSITAISRDLLDIPSLGAAKCVNLLSVLRDSGPCARLPPSSIAARKQAENLSAPVCRRRKEVSTMRSGIRCSSFVLVWALLLFSGASSSAQQIRFEDFSNTNLRDAISATKWQRSIWRAQRKRRCV